MITNKRAFNDFEDQMNSDGVPCPHCKKVQDPEVNIQALDNLQQVVDTCTKCGKEFWWYKCTVTVYYSKKESFKERKE